MGSAYRILKVAPTPFFSDRGCHIRILNEARVLLRSGNRVLISTYHLGADIPGVPTIRIPRIPWYQKISAGPSLHKVYLDMLLSLNTLARNSMGKPDVIHAHLHEGGLIGRALKAKFGCPLLLDIQGILSEEVVQHGFAKEGGFGDEFFRKLEGKILGLADHICTSSHALAERVESQFEVDAQQLSVLPDCVDTEHFQPRDGSHQLLGDLRINEDTKVVVFVGALSEYQGVDLLLGAMQRVVDDVKNVLLLIMGYPRVDHYLALAKKLGILHSTIFTGRISYSELPRYLALGDVAVAPKISFGESNGKLLVYMAMGLPTVAFDMSVNREILGNDGVFAEFNDMEDLAAKIGSLLSSGDGMSEKLRHRAIERYSYDSHLVRLLEIYKGILA